MAHGLEEGSPDNATSPLPLAAVRNLVAFVALVGLMAYFLLAGDAIAQAAGHLTVAAASSVHTVTETHIRLQDDSSEYGP